MTGRMITHTSQPKTAYHYGFMSLETPKIKWRYAALGIIKRSLHGVGRLPIISLSLDQMRKIANRKNSVIPEEPLWPDDEEELSRILGLD